MLPSHDEVESSIFLHHYRSQGLSLETLNEELRQKAEDENKLIVVSLGYSGNQACARFRKGALSDPQVIKLLKEKYLFSVVDAQIRPDLAHAFQNAARLLQQAGGYPLNLFLTPELNIFFATGALPARAQEGRPGFLELLEQMQKMWSADPKALKKQGDEIKAGLQNMEELKPSTSISASACRQAHRQLRELFDQGHGGFGAGPKFPLPASLNFLLQYGTQGKNDGTAMALSTLDEMAKGAIYDQIGGGFFRSTRDAAWQQPVFEKNLGDNAALILSYCNAYQLTGHPAYRRIIRETLQFIQDELQSAGGAFLSGTITQEQTSANQQAPGQYYFFSKRDLDKILGKKDAQIASLFYEVGAELKDDERALPTARGTLKKVAQQLGHPEALVAEVMSTVRERLKEARELREGKELNDLMIAGENALLLSALTKASVILDDEELEQRAKRLSEVFINQWLSPEQRVSHLYSTGSSTAGATSYLLDAALWGHALLDYAEAFGNADLLATSKQIFDQLCKDFRNDNSGSFDECLLKPGQVAFVSAWKIAGGASSGNASALSLGLRLARQLDSNEIFESMTSGLQASADLLRRAPHAHPLLLSTLQSRLNPALKISLTTTGKQTEVNVETPAEAPLTELIAQLRLHYLPTSFWNLNYNASAEENHKAKSQKAQVRLNLLTPDSVSESQVSGGISSTNSEHILHTTEEWNELLPPLLKRMSTHTLTEKGVKLTPGRAQAAATKSRTAHFPRPSTLGPWSISTIGAGTHRMGLDIEGHEAALTTAIKGGINLIDTSPTFAFGDAERLLGRVLRTLQDENPSIRDGIVVMTKAGVLVGAEAEELAHHADAHGVPPWTVPLEKESSEGKPSLAAGAFSLDPRLLCTQIETSRQRLGIETIDGVLLQSPEHLSSHGTTQEELQGALTEAFATLMKLKQEGKIQFTGVMCTTLVRKGRKAEPGEVSLDTIISAKRAAGITDDEPFCIALPINLGEKDALAPASYERKRAALGEEICAAGMQLLATRPLSTVTPEALFRLKEPGKSPDGASAKDLNSARYRVASLEAEFDTTFAAALRLAGLAGQGPVLQFSTQLGPTLEKSASLEQFNLGETTLVSPRLRQILGGLDQAHQGPEKAKYLKFRERYIQAIGAYLAAIREGAREKNRDFIQRILPDTTLCKPDDSAVDPIVRQALKEIIENPLVSASLVGLRKVEYVEQALKLLKQ